MFPGLSQNLNVMITSEISLFQKAEKMNNIGISGR